MHVYLYSVCLQVIAAARTQEELLRGEAEATKASTHTNAYAEQDCVCVLCVLLCSYTLACTSLIRRATLLRPLTLKLSWLLKTPRSPLSSQSSLL